MASTREDDMMRMQRMLDPGSGAFGEMVGQSLGTSIGSPIDPGSVVSEAEIDAIAGARSPSPMTDREKVQMLMDMGLDQRTAIEAVAIEKDMPPVDPRQFSGQQPAPLSPPPKMPPPFQQMQPQQMANPGMGALSGVPAGNERPMVMPTPRPEDLMMRQMPSGRDRTYNPRDAINPYNAPNT